MKIIFFGTPEFSAVILEALINNNYLPVLAVTAFDKPVGRKKIITPPPVKVLAQNHGIKVLQPENINNILLAIRKAEPDLIIVVAYGQIFSKELLGLPKFGCLNLHFSLLPKYRGTFPIPYEILDGEKETGVTIVKMSEKVDKGDIVAQEKIAILPNDTTVSLTQKLTLLGGDLLIKTIPLWISGKINPLPQGQSPTLYCKKLKKEDGRINWKNQAEYIEGQIRAFYPWPGTFTFFKGKALKILKAYVIKENTEPSKPGFIFLSRSGKLTVQTKKDSLVIETLQLEGGKPLSAQDFLRGHRDIVGALLK